MADVSQWFGQDLEVSPSGDIQTIDGFYYTSQRIVRRLMTIVKDYIWQPEYGASLPVRVGQKLDLQIITSIIVSQILLEDTVAKSPVPSITVTEVENGVSVNITYTDASSGKAVALAFDVGGQ
jgi:hypothetical protein